MRDPHVQVIHFSVGTGDGISYREPEPVTFANHLGAFNLVEGSLSIVPAEHFSNEEDARRALEPFLRAWEMEADLSSNLGMIRFSFDRVDLIDRDPPPPGSAQVIQIRGISSLSFIAHPVTLNLTCRKYPQPPHAFRVTPEVQHAYRRWLGYRSGKEPLQSMAYFVLTLLESTAGGRKFAAQSFTIDLEVLQKIGQLSSTKGDPETARKASTGTQFQELTSTERQWLEKAISQVILRLGEHASGTPLSAIRLTDLPSI